MKYLSRLIFAFILFTGTAFTDAGCQARYGNRVIPCDTGISAPVLTGLSDNADNGHFTMYAGTGNTMYLTGKENNPVTLGNYGGLLVSASLMTYGIVALNNPLLHKWDLAATQYVTDNIHRKYRIDDYIQYAPALAVYGVTLCGAEAKHNFRDRTIVMASSYLLTAGAVNLLKATIDVKRPDSNALNSFPSGHTATAFTGAHILFREYKDVSPWIGVGGYIVAAATGALRVVNKRHRISDVIMGAGIGIAAAELGYILLPLIQKAFGITAGGNCLSLEPVTGYNYYGLGLSRIF